ncbi:MAG: hypothetical protein IJ047_01540 [Paludibacteraceae bacterium]|nr:hypothetical protein [Paludibacteraceae bacterium]
MTRNTQTILYYLLPVAFWLLAIGGALLPVFLLSTFNSQLSTLHYFLPSVPVLLAALRLTHIHRHASAVEPAFQMAVLLGIASYWLPTVLFLLLPAWIYLAYCHLMEWRVIWATLIGLALVAIWVAVFVYFGLIEMPSLDGMTGVGYWAWLPSGAFLIAFIASSIARYNLRVR